MEISLIANTGIHFATCDLEIDAKEKFSAWFYEWYDMEKGNWILELAHEVNVDSHSYVYRKHPLHTNGFLLEATGDGDIDVSTLAESDIYPLSDNDKMCDGVAGDVYKLTFADRNNNLNDFENKWLPLPYFTKTSEKSFLFGPFNWSRFMLVPRASQNGKRCYKVLLAFDTRTASRGDQYNECPIFRDDFATSMELAVCSKEFSLMEYCSPNPEWEYIDTYLFSLVHPELHNRGYTPGKVRVGRKLSYVASYFLLVNYIAQKHLFPKVVLHKDQGVVVQDVDMVVDIGNSRTTALLVEGDFNQVQQLQLVDYSNIVQSLSEEGCLPISQEPFDMRLAFRKVNLGDFGIENGRQFVYPSFVRLGREANYLIHKATEKDEVAERVTTMSSPKRYLWDSRKNKEEWQYMLTEGEEGSILHIQGISEQLQSDGCLVSNGVVGLSNHYSRRSMMTFAFLEMLVQAQRQINSDGYRMDRGDMAKPRRIRRVIVTCPTAMSKVEREALVCCASDAVKLLNGFSGVNSKVEVVPAVPSKRDVDSYWYFDEATCSQLVYIYGEIGYKYKGSCQEFFNIYGKAMPSGSCPELTVGSLDIGAGTTDLMISKYTYHKGAVTTITPDPIFYDSFYYAGDDMLNEMIKKVMFFSDRSALRRGLKGLTDEQYRQKLRNFFGPNYSGQTARERHLRRDFNLQYSVPLMYRLLELLSQGSKDCKVRYKEIFEDCPPSENVLRGFEDHFGMQLQDLEWDYCAEEVATVVEKSFEPLLKKIATIMHVYRCDIVLLSGRPSSLSPIRNIFLKYYTVSPNRLISLNNYFVGHWYPFGNNTGVIANPKTIVAVGALVCYYATSMGSLNGFVIDKSKLDNQLRSVVNYVETTMEAKKQQYLITPRTLIGELTVSTLPIVLKVRQLDIPNYPSRKLYVIDYNSNKIANDIRTKAITDGENLTDHEVLAKVKEVENSLRLRMPFRVTIERDADDKEQLAITSVVDRNDKDVVVNNLEINIQSLDAGDDYWLDTGVFEIQ